MRKRFLYTVIYLGLLSFLGYGCFRNVSANLKSTVNQIDRESARVTSAVYLFAIQENDPLRAN
jgi:hypothetical protein